MKDGLKRYWPLGLLVLVLAAAVAGWFLLPARLVVQMGPGGGAANVMDKLPALLLPAAFGVVGAGFGCTTRRRGLGLTLLAVAGIILTMTYIWNL